MKRTHLVALFVGSILTVFGCAASSEPESQEPVNVAPSQNLTPQGILSCVANGAACTSNSECCSNFCYGATTKSAGKCANSGGGIFGG